MNTSVILEFLGGLVFLIVGAEALVKGATRLSILFGVSPLIIGLTVVAFGTSSPELAVSIKASLSNQPGISLGNVVGSNIFNVLFILGIASLIRPLVVAQQLIRFDVPLLIFISILTLVLATDKIFSRADGLVLFAGLIIYIGFLLYQSRSESSEVKKEYEKEIQENAINSKWPASLGLVIGGMALLIVGSQWMVDGSVSIAQYLGVSELIIALTIIAAGTSLPEVVTSIVATIRNQGDIAVGNVIGSNIFNIMGVLGISSILSTNGIVVSAPTIEFDLPIMVAVACACLPIFFTGQRINRWEGAVLLGYYIAYIVYLVLNATHHNALPQFNIAMIYFVVPLTTVSIAIVAVREFRAKSRK